MTTGVKSEKTKSDNVQEIPHNSIEACEIELERICQMLSGNQKPSISLKEKPRKSVMIAP